MCLVLFAASCSSSEPVSTRGGEEPAESATAEVADAEASTSGGEDPPSTTSDEPLETLPGITACEDLPSYESSMPGVLGSRSNPDDRLMGVIYTYTQEHPDTFAGRWIDRDNDGAIVVAFTDDPEPHRAALLSRGPLETDEVGVEPPPPITDPRPLSQRDDFVFDVIQLEFSEQELRATQVDLRRLFEEPGTGLDGMGVDITKNRVTLWSVDPTPAGLATIAAAAVDKPVCVSISYSPAPPEGDLHIIPEPGEPLVFPPGLGEVRWELDPAYPAPSPSDTEIHVLATETACASGRDMGDALRGPQVVETETEVLIAFAVVSDLRSATCQGNPPTAVTVLLDSPLGDRTLENGAAVRREPPGITLPSVEQPVEGEGWRLISSTGAIEDWAAPVWAGTLNDYWIVVDTFWEQDLTPDGIDFDDELVVAFSVPLDFAGACGPHILTDLSTDGAALVPSLATPDSAKECDDLFQVFVVAVERNGLPDTVELTDPDRDVTLTIRAN